MRVLLFGRTGMIGQGALRECLLDPAVTAATAVVRSATGQTHEKLHELVVPDLAALGDDLSAHDACFFCLGVSAAGMSEAEYRGITKDLTLAIARPLAAKNPAMAFLYVSGQGTDSTEKGRAMWARVKGETENALLALPFRSAFMLRPGFIRPLHGIRSRTPLYRALYAVFDPLAPVIGAVTPNVVTDTERLGRAMIALARGAPGKRVVEMSEINALGR